MDSNGPRWSDDVRQADWMRSRLTPWDGEHVITIFVPAGFEAYARVLHPVDVPENGGRLVRWADVAAWSGLPLRAGTQFHSIALPSADPGRPYPFGSGQGPREGTLYTEDARVLAAIAAGWTSTPRDCWFCVSDGFGWDAVSVSAAFTADGQPPEVISEPEPHRDPVPGTVRDGPRVRLPNRDYLLYTGPAGDVTATAALGGPGHGGDGQCGDGLCATLWWPADLAWCVAGDVDLQWTYVGGPRGLIDAILADERIEALPASPDDPVSRVEDWVAAWVDELTDGLLANGEASLTTCRGSVEARLRRPRRPGRLRKGELSIFVTAAGSDDSSGGSMTLSGRDDLRKDLALYLTLTILGLAGT